MFKKGIAVLIASLGLCMAIIPSTHVSANNHTDTGWSFWLGNGQRNSYTDARAKTDASYAYIYNAKTSKTGVNAWVQYANGKECGSPKTRALPGNARKIWNNAFENEGYRRTYIRLAIEQDRNLWVDLYAEGVWSPDSV
ncbi:hypothetical protein ACR74Y_13250 [Lacticaseibacillus rhamnosus]|uniref:hypothetical protein n=1 Tax=Lacticaseibacillus rhamnosus TaxID=47715 RepID=UPI00065ADA87|nr:hypothetical protein [Lacticaseibacillus rhamnosus]KMO45714.1 hypothetical protein PY95_12120 [Lacticaseibacillus rhamnosus]MDE3295255.1 hypothetical protein [Lacticaseibacillus rhamnosus]OAT97316.1 hypothetical protein PY72_12120 [Lacticaseibacillus rhamnosus]